MRKTEVWVDEARTKKGIAIAKLPRPEKGHKYVIVPTRDGYYTEVFVVDVVKKNATTAR